MRYVKTLIILSLLAGILIVAGCKSNESYNSGTGYATYTPPPAPSAGGCGVVAPVVIDSAPSVESSVSA